jgi:hypothetical protein
MRNKNGSMLLPEETLKIVIAVICIGFLVIALVALYFSIRGGQDKKKAEASMKDAISEEIIRINDGGEYNSNGIPVPNPSGWYLFSFAGTESKPNLCTGMNCVCICDSVKVNLFNWQKRQIEKCDDKGSCFIVSNLKKFEKIRIEKDGVSILINKINNEIQISKK